MRGRKWKAEEKMAIVLEGLKNEGTITDICRRHTISQSQYYKWRDRFLEIGKQGLSSGNVNNKDYAYKSDLARL